MLWERYFMLFFVCAVMGWVLEVVTKLVELRRFINRGFLIGPYCPIYGVGAVLISALLNRYADDPLVVFVLSVALCGTLEYLTSYVMEKLFHARWWDYSHRFLNLNGRVCARTLIPFGLMGLALFYLVDPFLLGLFERIPAPAMRIVCCCLFGALLCDIVLSTCVLSKIRRTAELSGEDDTEMLTARVREVLLRSKNALAYRILRAFPATRLYNRPALQKLRAASAELRAEFSEKRMRMRQELDQWEQRFRKELRARKHK